MLLLVLWIYAGGARAAEMIAHPGVAIQTLTVNEARSMFGMRQLSWSSGLVVRVFVLPQQNSLHDVFCREVLNIYPYQLQQSWNRLVYSGTGQAPVEVASEQEMLARVAATPGAIGYVNKVKSNDTVHTISVR
ncbi:MAG: hypothetical protein NTY60_03175 [Proteobacteria bacterium]|nr:hypothetical protein [Pseudomonadota bacterium]